MLGCKPTKTVIEPNHRMGYATNCVPRDKERYQKLVGKLTFLILSQSFLLGPV